MEEDLTLPEDVSLAEEHEELRLRGLRILASMIVRAYLRDMGEVDRDDGTALPIPEYDRLAEEEPDVA